MIHVPKLIQSALKTYSEVDRESVVLCVKIQLNQKMKLEKLIAIGNAEMAEILRI